MYFNLITFLASIFLPTNINALPQKLKIRQSPGFVQPDITPANDSQNNQGGGGSITTIEIVIPVVIIVVVAIVLIISIKYRAKLSSLFKSTSLSRISGSSTTRTNITAEQLSGHSSSNSATNIDQNPGSTTTAPLTAAERRARRIRDRERNIRRTESGRSVKTLPVYSKDAGDEELVLVRQRSQSSFSSGSFTDDDAYPDEGPEGDIERGLLPAHDRSNSTRSSRTHNANDENAESSGTRGAGEEEQQAETAVGESPSPITDESPHQSQTTRLSSNSDPSPHQRSDSLARRESLARRSWGLAPTYLEAMSSPLSYPESSDNSSTTVPKDTLRTRTSSTFRGLLSRAGFNQPSAPSSSRSTQQMRENRNSSTSLLLQPTTSRMSTNTATSSYMLSRSRSPSTSTTNIASNPITGLPWESTNSLLMISSPMPNTTLRSSFDSSSLPKAGLSEDQMKFLSSKEAINTIGIKFNNNDNDETPQYRKRSKSKSTVQGNSSIDLTFLRYQNQAEGSGIGPSRRGSNENRHEEEISLPSWEMSEQLRRQNEAFERRNLSRPVSSDGKARDNAESTDQNGISTGDFSGTSEQPNGGTASDATPEQQSNQAKPNSTIKPIPPPIQVNIISEPREQDIGTPASSNTFMTAQPSPTSTITPHTTTNPNTLTSATFTTPNTLMNSAMTPRFEVEPPTPIVSTPPPRVA
ncbi:uncharacterized protein L201_003635 [Kwoniella dendrophila CBS 6074]|uniref:Uncharacterized protein n=1 Tax=Kwoniella dendrophila CBS 6074 TaxID=1295534 RepID=A0AAX4JVX9_9TREE